MGELILITSKYKDGEPCEHKGCLNHISHSCEGCGRRGGYSIKESISEFRGKFYFLSNFFPCKVTIKGITYPSAEHAFVAMKTKDIEIRRQVADYYRH